MDFYEHLHTSLIKEEADKLIASLEGKDYHAVLLNTNKISDDEFLKEFPHVTPHPLVAHAYLYNKEEYPLGKHLYHELGYYYLQEPSAMVVSSLLDFKEDDVVLDLCAAPGGKSVQASFKMNEKGLIISNDISTPRSFIISQNAERLGLKNLLITNNDFELIYQHFENTFDKIIVDAPCSGSGMFRKNTLVKEDWSINKVYKFAEIQKRLIEIAYFMLKEGGKLIYSTCSYSKEEDEDVIEHLLSKTDAKVEKLEFEGGYVNELSPIGVRLMPSHFNGEGQYMCVISKPGTKKENKFINENKFQSLLVSSYKYFDVKKYGDSVFAISNMIATKGLKVIRYGVKVGEYKKDIFRYDLHYARSLDKNDNFQQVELTLEEVKQYLEGNVLNKANENKGYVLLTYNKNSIDIAKTDGRVIKNYYPKGLRKKF